MENIDALKNETAGRPAYRLKNANVFVSPGGYHYIDYLDATDQLSPEIDASSLTAEEVAYIEKMLQSNAERFSNQAAIVSARLPRNGARVLDIGCGGGLFLSKLTGPGVTVTGVELSDSRAAYAARKYGLEIIKRPIEADYWSRHLGAFDVVTMWDVIEHVNYPRSTLLAATAVLKPGGLMFIDTPCRDSFYHRVGEMTYKVSRGRFPTFLNTMYSGHRFGHKQIFSTGEMRALFEEAGLEVVELKKFHELSFPYGFYLKKMVKSSLLVKLLLPAVNVFFAVFPVKNKMLVVGRKK
jgi:2-polyprenyl-6-hydroxyphenyl methylase/3-demethylubiquinone-9 3-methyltransferase